MRACSRVKDSVSPSFRAASVATIRSRAGTWISGSSSSTVIEVPSRAALPESRTGGGDEQAAEADADHGPDGGGAGEGGDRSQGDRGHREARRGRLLPAGLVRSRGRADDDQR